MDDLEQLYQTTYTAVVRFLYRKVWDADRAEDLAQEVFVRALAHRPEKPRAWVFAVAANLARDEARAAILQQLFGEMVAHPLNQIPLVFTTSNYALSKKVTGFKPTILGFQSMDLRGVGLAS